jgi:hypothetical protein
MLARALSTTAILLSTAAAVAADAALPAVETMTCDQMMAEMIVAGQKMNAQMDPEFAKEAQAMMDEAQAGPSAGAMVSGVGQAVACSLPGIGLFCALSSQMPGMGAAGATEENLARMEAQMERFQRATEGIDMVRLEAMSQRFEAQKCQVPQDGAATP